MSEFIEKKATKLALKRRRPVFGVGINDAEYMIRQKINGVRTACPYYQVWCHMLERCFSAKLHERSKTYKNCTIQKEWLIFSNFRAWMKPLDWKGKQLDKDILIIGNKHYGPETCVFVSQAINLLLTDHKAARGKYPIGVDLCNGKLRARCCVNGKEKHLGVFPIDNVHEAAECYRRVKYQEVVRAAVIQSDIRVRRGLYTHAKHILKG